LSAKPCVNIRTSRAEGGGKGREKMAWEGDVSFARRARPAAHGAARGRAARRAHTHAHC